MGAKERKMWLLVGLPAAGKSTIADLIVEREGALLIDADEAKKRLPEYNGGVLEDAVHEERTDISKDVLERAIKNNDNLIYSTIGKDAVSLEKKIRQFEDAGYEINLVYVDLPVEKAVERAKNRFRDEGRLFPTSKIKAIGTKPKAIYDEMKHRKGIESYEAWNNDVERGAAPKLLERSGKAEATTDSRTGQLRGDDERRPIRGGDERSDSVPQGARDDSGEVNTEADASRSNQGGFSNAIERIINKAFPASGKRGKAVKNEVAARAAIANSDNWLILLSNWKIQFERRALRALQPSLRLV